jgi:predicted O-linked N-acetylglucosamine transferase (SPINDLY family)/glycosyltransferase involved in cell wall biosynthesis
MPTDSQPLVSIAMPVYNGDRYICQALDSLLAQDYNNFELLISDNASTDSTAEICQKYAANNPKIRYFRNSTNIGAISNFNQAFKLSTGKYFMWAAHDDLWAPSYVSKCLAQLELHPNAVLCFSEIHVINELGYPINSEYNQFLDTVGKDIPERIRRLTYKLNWYDAIYGLMRADALKKTNLMSAKYGGDVILLMELMLLGEFAKVPEKLFAYRLLPNNHEENFVQPYTSLAKELMSVSWQSNLSPEVKSQIHRDFVETLCSNQSLWLSTILMEKSMTFKMFSSQEHLREFVEKTITPDLKLPSETSMFASEEHLREFVETIITPDLKLSSTSSPILSPSNLVDEMDEAKLSISPQGLPKGGLSPDISSISSNPSQNIIAKNPNPNIGINIAGYVNGEFGIGEGVRANIRAIEAIGIPFVINNFTRSPHRKQDTSYQNFSQDNPYPINLIQVNADEVKTFLKYSGASYLENHYNIGFWAWELPAFPPEWQPAFNQFHEIWTYSNACAEAISIVSPIPVIKIMPSISLVQPSIDREALGLPQDKFIFLFIFDFYSRIERKNPLAVIEAFNQAFGNDDRVLLIVKSANSSKFVEQQKLLNSAIAKTNCANIKHIDGYLSKDRINALLYNCDCYISLHRCEGFGLTMAEAMFYGKPVIATGYSSNTEFMNVGNSFLVKYKLVPITADFGPYKKGNIWAEPNTEHAAYLMRHVFNNYQEAQEIGKIGAEEIQTLLNPQVTGSKIQKRLEYIAEITDNFSAVKSAVQTATIQTKSADVDLQKSVVSQPASVGFVTEAKTKPNAQPLVSICIPTYNGAAFLGEAIQSAIAQTYPNIELIISDDGSTDETIAIARSFQSQTAVDFRIVLHRNYGLSQNWNFCISQAKGEYIKFLFQDDLLEPECIEKMVALAQQNPEIGLVFSPRGIVIAETEANPILRTASHSIKDLYKSWSNLKSVQNGQELLADANCLKNPINKIGEPSTVLIPARVFAEIGLFDSTLSQYVDLDMWWRIMANYQIGFVNEKLSSLRIHPEQQTWKNFAAGENSKDVVRFYRKILNSDDYSLLNQEIKQQIRQKLALRTQPILSDFARVVAQYKKSSSKPSVLEQLRQHRQEIAEYWLNLPPEKLESAYLGETGKAHKLLLDSGIKNEILTDTETSSIQTLVTKIAQGEITNQIQYLLATMLYCEAYQLPLEYKNAAIPQWFFEDFLQFLFHSPIYFQATGEVAKYSAYFQQLISYVAANIASFPDSEVWRYLSSFFVKNVSCQALYLSEANLVNVWSQQSDIVSFYLKNIGCQVDYDFDKLPVPNNKITLGILVEKISSDSETLATIPVFEYLDRNKFEIIVYYFQNDAEELGKYCETRADKLVQLAGDLQNQVQEIRSHNLDILLIATDITDIAKTTALLSVHRLARLQIATAASTPIIATTRNIDRIITGNLTLPLDAPTEYREKLITLPGSGICFSYPIASASATVEPTRRSWGATDQSVVFVSSVAAFKIIPELRETWAKIIASVPNSILVLCPFGYGQENYPTMPFFNQMRSTFVKSGIDKNRLVMIRALPTRADCIKCLELADIYLDSYPDSGASSLVEPLQVGLPVVTREGQKNRSHISTALLKELQLPELVTTSENSYVELSIALGNNLELRQQYRTRLQQTMATNPKFLDSRAYSSQLGTVFEEIFHKGEWKK